MSFHTAIQQSSEPFRAAIDDEIARTPDMDDKPIWNRVDHSLQICHQIPGPLTGCYCPEDRKSVPRRPSDSHDGSVKGRSRTKSPNLLFVEWALLAKPGNVEAIQK